MIRKVGGKGGLLIFGNRIHIAESPAGGIALFKRVHKFFSRAFRLINSVARQNLRRPDIGNPRTIVREIGYEDVAGAQTAYSRRIQEKAADTMVAGCLQGLYSLQSQFEKFVALALLISNGDLSFHAAIRNGVNVSRIEYSAFQLSLVRSVFGRIWILWIESYFRPMSM